MVVYAIIPASKKLRQDLEFKDRLGYKANVIYVCVCVCG